LTSFREVGSSRISSSLQRPVNAREQVAYLMLCNIKHAEQSAEQLHILYRAKATTSVDTQVIDSLAMRTAS
jgi:hypothetical protein